ncbi:MAG: serine/threonine-protein kinase [Deltaproteobacteria bacterium]
MVGERYRLEEWLERGAMGSVWRAKQVRLRSKAAIKFLEPNLIEVPEMLERFLQEARSAAAVQSAHVIQVFDYGSEGGIPYIAMEFLEGENLDARLARRGVLTPAELDKIFSELARGLGQAHAMGVIHRDVKPGNIFLAREGRHEITKLIDFGIAKVKADALRVSQIIGTELGTLLGTPQYMSPEQMRGRSTLDQRTDLWALAIIACECLTGCYPFSGTTIGDLTVQICTEEPLAPSTLGDVPAGFDQWFFKGTCKEPSDRFSSAPEMADALTKILLVAGNRVPATVRVRPLRLLPSARALRRAWSATSGCVLHFSALASDRAGALGARSAAWLRTSMRALRQWLPRLETRRVWSRSGALGLALVVVACGLVLLRSGRVAPPSFSAAAPSQVVQSQVVQSQVVQTMSPTRPALPVLTPDELPLAAAPAVNVPSKTTKKPVARPREKKSSSPAASSNSDQTPLGPMSAAMQRMGALLAKGGDKRRPARAAEKAAVRAPSHANAKRE